MRFPVLSRPGFKNYLKRDGRPFGGELFRLFLGQIIFGSVGIQNRGTFVAVRAKITLGALAGMQDTSALSDYLIMLIDPDTGKIYYLELDEESFDPETGAITIDFPCLGAFSLIKK